mgnify:CR=1 FL=1
MSLVSELKTIADYNPTAYVNNSEPDLDAEHLNKTEQALKRVTDAANDAINALKELEEQKLSLNAIVQTESTATDKVPSSAYLKQALGTINSNLSQKANSSDLTNVSNVAAAANGKVELSGGPIKIIAYSGDGKWAFQQQYNDGNILSLSINDTQIAYDYYDGKTWTNKWTK